MQKNTTDYQSYYEKRSSQGAYQRHLAGDVSCFRYPQLEEMKNAFRYQAERKYWQFVFPGMFSGSADGFPMDPDLALPEGEECPALLRKIGAEDITLYEFLVPEAKLLHGLDMAGAASSYEEKQAAFEGVCGLYAQRQALFPDVTMETVTLSSLQVRRGFEAVAELYKDLADVPVRMVTLRFPDINRITDKKRKCTPFPFGSMLKGTDLVFTDGNRMNFGQDLLHALYHLREGIPGAGDDNMFVEEWWADVPSLYAMQLAKGRMARRKRLRPSPHPIHFTDYIYLRALLGQAFVAVGPAASGSENAEDGLLHPLYRVIEPSIRLMLYVMQNSGKVRSDEEMVRILTDAVLKDETQRLQQLFELTFGEGSFAAVYDTYGIYEKLERAARFADRKLLDDILFGDAVVPDLLPPCPDCGDIERIWKDPAYRPAAVRDMIPA